MLRLREATADDVPLILRLIRELALYERDPGAVVASEADLLRDGFGPLPLFQVLLAEWNGEAAGFAFWFFNYSTWLGRKGLYLEDLFVLPRLRGAGIGRALLAQLGRIAQRERCGRVQWQVLDWNEPAIGFYKSLGAEVMEEWLTLRVEGDEAIARLAGDAVDGSEGNPR
jgi:GNAT superfamily N-acetyltransferase